MDPRKGMSNSWGRLSISLKRTSAAGCGSELEVTIFDQVGQTASSERFAMWWAASLWRSASSFGSISRSLFTAPVKSKFSLDRTSEMGSVSANSGGFIFGFGEGVEVGGGEISIVGVLVLFEDANGVSKPLEIVSSF